MIVLKFLFATLVVAFISAAPTSAAKVPGRITVIESADKFCLMLPPEPNSSIAKHEHHAVAFCTFPNIGGATGAQQLPQGFITTAHFVQNAEKKWVQVTGRMDGEKYGLSRSDGGGQYDVKASPGSSCVGYKYYVELVEPNRNIYCIRCCQSKADCPVNMSTHGCERVLGGIY